jgi:trehalose 6-phosphate phosphatase
VEELVRHLLSADNQAVLAHLARSNALIAFDFDGTLASIVAERGRAALRPDTERLLARLCACYPCAVITGRSRADVLARLGSAAIKYAVGNHGLEPDDGPAGFEQTMAAIRPLIEAALVQHAGLDIEDKRYSLAVHYRNSPAKRRARAAIQRVVATLPVAVRLVPGKCVLNVIPHSAPHKGDALLQLRHREGAQIALYVGDDVTDEDVFQLEQQGSLVAARVGRSKSSAARYFLRDQGEIDALLARLVDLRSGAVPS